MAQLPQTFINVSDIYERIEYLEEVVKVLADSIQKVNDSNKVLSDVIKQLLEDKKHNGIKEEVDKGTERQEKLQSINSLEELQTNNVSPTGRRRSHNRKQTSKGVSSTS